MINEGVVITLKYVSIDDGVVRRQANYRTTILAETLDDLMSQAAKLTKDLVTIVIKQNKKFEPDLDYNFACYNLMSDSHSSGIYSGNLLSG